LTWVHVARTGSCIGDLQRAWERQQEFGTTVKLAGTLCELSAHDANVRFLADTDKGIVRALVAWLDWCVAHRTCMLSLPKDTRAGEANALLWLEDRTGAISLGLTDAGMYW
jgi:hypothetical protein